MVERLERFADIFFGIHEVENKRAILALADTIQTAERLNGLDPSQLLIDYHRMQ